MSWVAPHLLQRAKRLYRTVKFLVEGGIESRMSSFSCITYLILSVALIFPSRLDFNKNYG